MVFKARTDGSDSLKAVISSVATLVEEATFEATGEGLAFKGMDPSHVALIDIWWPNSAFAAYECDSEVRFGVRVDELSKLVRRAAKSDDVGITVDDDNMLQLKMGTNRQYRMRLIEPSSNETPLPRVPFDTRVLLPAPALDKILGDVQVMSEYLTITATQSGATFVGSGDSGDASVSLSAEDATELSAEKESKGTYSLEYLLPVVRAVGSTSENISCEFSTAKPLRVGFTISGMGHIHFYLAPRVES